VRRRQVALDDADEMMNLVYAQATDPGRVRRNNEDNLLALPERGVFIVADGMGGADGGELASGMVVDTVRQRLTDRAEDEHSLSSLKRTVSRAIRKTSQAIYEYAESHDMRGMGSTVVALICSLDARERSAVVMHAGDSRAYRFRQGVLMRVTRDHSVAEAADVPEEDLSAILRNTVTRAVGIKPTVKLDETLVSLTAGDVVLICSDGLSRMLDDAAIARIISERLAHGLRDVAARLVQAANDAGGKDNISLILVQGEWPALGAGDETSETERPTEESTEIPREGETGRAPKALPRWWIASSFAIVVMLIAAWSLRWRNRVETDRADGSMLTNPNVSMNQTATETMSQIPAEPSAQQRRLETVGANSDGRLLHRRLMILWVVLFVAALAGGPVLGYIQRDVIVGYLRDRRKRTK